MSNSRPTPPTPALESLATCRRKVIELISLADSHWAEAQWRMDVEACRKAAAAAVFQALQSRKSVEDLDQAGAILNQLHLCGANEFASSPTCVEAARAYAAQGWPGVAAAAMLIPAWQADFMPPPGRVPLWLLPFYAIRGFSVPKLLTAEGQARGVARAYLATLESLVEIAEANRGSFVAQALIERFRATEVSPILTLDPSLHIEIRAQRARLIAALHRKVGCRAPESPARAGQTLRIGIIAQQIGDTPAAHSLWQLVERLPRERIEITVLSIQQTQSRIERHLIERASMFTVMGGDLEQLTFSLQEANLDVGIFLLDAPWLDNPIAQLALQRILPLQIIHDGTGLPSGLPGADLFTAAPYASSTLGERGLLLAPGGTLGTGGITPEEKPEPWTRHTLGLEAEGVLYGHFGQLSLITPELVSAWGRILASVPDSRLVLVGPGEPGFRLDRFCATIGTKLAKHGVGLERIGVFGNVTLATHPERQAAVGAFDILLEASPASTAGVTLAALEEGRPLITLAQPLGSAAALLREAGVSDCVATSLEHYVELASRLGRDNGLRSHLAQEITERSRPVLLRHDSFALGESFACTIESACASGQKPARTGRTGTPPQTPEVPTDAAAMIEEAGLFLELGALPDAERRLHALLPSADHAAEGRRKLAEVWNQQNRHREATDLLASVVNLLPHDPGIWIELSALARRAGLNGIATEALQTAVRLDPKRIESWTHLAELARETNHHELLQEINGVLHELGATGPAPAIAPAFAMPAFAP